MGYPTMVVPTQCSDILQDWIKQLTESDRDRLRIWGISTGLLGIARVEVSRYFLCAAARFWKSDHHVFRFGRIELTPTLEEVHRICCLQKFLGPTVFMRREGYSSVLSKLTGLPAGECGRQLICTDGLVPMLKLAYFDRVAGMRASLGDELWLKGFVVRFLGELIFSHGRMVVGIEVAEIALAVVTYRMDLAPVILAETYRALDRSLRRCRHFYGCGAFVQVWMAAHLGLAVLRPQQSAFESYHQSGHAHTLTSVQKEYERLQCLTEQRITWRIMPSAACNFEAFFNTTDMRLIVLPGLTGGVEYHPIRVMRQFGYQQDSLTQGHMPTRFKEYPLSSYTITRELSRLLSRSVCSKDLPAIEGRGCTAGYEAEVEETWPICSAALSRLLFTKSSGSKRLRDGEDS